MIPVDFKFHVLQFYSLIPFSGFRCEQSAAPCLKPRPGVSSTWFLGLKRSTWSTWASQKMPRSFSTRWAQNYSADRWCGKEFWVSIWADSKSVLDVFKAKRRKTPGVYTRTLYTFLVYRSGFCFWVPCHCTQFSDEDSFLQNMQMSSVCFGFRATVLSSQINIHFF